MVLITLTAGDLLFVQRKHDLVNSSRIRLIAMVEQNINSGVTINLAQTSSSMFKLNNIFQHIFVLKIKHIINKC